MVYLSGEKALKKDGCVVEMSKRQTNLVSCGKDQGSNTNQDLDSLEVIETKPLDNYISENCRV